MMSFDDAESRELRQALAAVAETAVPRDDCPAAERIWTAVAGELPPEDLRDVVDHTAQCAVCAESWRLAVELKEEEASEALPENGFWRSWLQVAALVVVIAGAGWLLRPDGAPSPGPVRGGDGAEISAVTPQNRALPRDDFVLRWTGPELRYEVEVTWITAEASKVVFGVQDLARTEVRVPPEALAGVPPEAVLLWEVTAFENGEQVDRKTFKAHLE